ncbi:SAM-dependent chlorinase/fluorinase (plasmid) [Geminicoccaceae bacterium 1502E]|nr:SAM-dependent chlorinase/fluorinase [Geminicoccaceae bacterium 1502E]
MILTFTDFGVAGPYLGQMRAVLLRAAPEIPVIDLMSDVPAFEPRLAAVLLAALEGTALTGDVVLAVVDPGVGTERAPLALEVDGRWFVGPDNGLFELVLRRAREARSFRIAWRPDTLSASFHGRDLFAPVAAGLARGRTDTLEPAAPLRFPDWPDEPPLVAYVDGYGNAMTGLVAARLPPAAVVEAGGRRLARVRTFGEAAPGEPFWYENSLGLVEIAANGTSAAALLKLAPGTSIHLTA